MKRLFDLIMGFILLILLVIPMLIIAFFVRFTSRGPVIYWSNRIGRYNVIFRMPKFRSMHDGTIVVATHLMQDPDAYLSSVGKFLRRSSLDELPQLYSIIKGDMSFVGP
ncbi:MAG: sugar transferase, partial [Methylococcales bacterium]|nr:sugar transferase [Methylococcales bacterium]